MLGFSTLMGSVFTGFARPQEAVKASAISGALTLTLDILLIPRYGLMGAAAASLTAYFAGSVRMLYAYLRFSGSPASEVLLLKRCDIGVYRDRLRVLLGNRRFP
jgi:O-antigen/teichoic acid export membrane protein